MQEVLWKEQIKQLSYKYKIITVRAENLITIRGWELYSETKDSVKFFHKLYSWSPL